MFSSKASDIFPFSFKKPQQQNFFLSFYCLANKNYAFLMYKIINSKSISLSRSLQPAYQVKQSIYNQQDHFVVVQIKGETLKSNNTSDTSKQSLPNSTAPCIQNASWQAVVSSRIFHTSFPLIFHSSFQSQSAFLVLFSLGLLNYAHIFFISVLDFNTCLSLQVCRDSESSR